MFDAEKAVNRYQVIASHLNKRLAKSGPEAWIHEMDARSSWYAEVGEMAADAKAWYDTRYAEVSEEVMGKHERVTPSVLDKLVKGKTAQEKRVVDILDQLLKTLSKQMDNLRTMISYEKEGRRQN